MSNMGNFWQKKENIYLFRVWFLCCLRETDSQARTDSTLSLLTVVYCKRPRPFHQVDLSTLKPKRGDDCENAPGLGGEGVAIPGLSSVTNQLLLFGKISLWLNERPLCHSSSFNGWGWLWRSHHPPPLWSLHCPVAHRQLLSPSWLQTTVHLIPATDPQ